LDGNTSLLSYFVTSEKILAFVITRDSFNVVELPVGREKLNAEVSSFRRFDNTNEAHPDSLRRLHDWLIAPLKPYIKTPVLGIIPHGVLHYLPFAALTDGNSYLGERYKLFHLPSASVMKFIRGKVKPVASSRLLAIAQSRAEGLEVLDYADAEAETVARLYDTKAFLTGSMSKADFMNRARDYDILHIVAHAELNLSNPLFTRIVIGSDANGTERSGYFEVNDVYGLDLTKATLVVLSACDTHVGRQSKGDDITGLNRAFIYAGTPTVIASLWAVNDESSSYLMERFYTNLKRGMDKAEALQAAQLETRRKYPSSYYWAGFVLTGDPGVK
jgi:CHAT domain-containing protein